MMKETIDRKEAIDAFAKAVHVLGVLDAEDIKTVFRLLSSEDQPNMKKVRVLEKVKAFPFDGYRKLTSYDNVIFVTAERHDETDYFCLHLGNGLTATYNTVDYIMEFL